MDIHNFLLHERCEVMESDRCNTILTRIRFVCLCLFQFPRRKRITIPKMSVCFHTEVWIGPYSHTRKGIGSSIHSTSFGTPKSETEIKHSFGIPNPQVMIDYD